MKKSLPAVVIVLAIIGVVFAVVGGTAAQTAKTQAAKASVAKAPAAEPHPHIYKAYRLLKRAHYVLQHACRNLSGDRAGALSQVDSAINELQLAIAVDHGTAPAVAESEAINITPGQLHPYVHDALRQCREAKTELAAAAQDFGGHRTNAVQHVDAAIAQLEQAVKLPPC
jgi:hypothetical protein